ncbi:MAG: hypothetical protein ACHQO8_12460 [Vicinamibacterales bacterium]
MGPIVVTAASSNHFGPLRYLLDSLRALDAHVECYDIGLTDEEARALPRWPRLFYHKFDFASHPPHMNVAIAAGEYAWKPVIVAEVVDRMRAAGEPADVLWADAGTYFHALEPMAGRIRSSDGVWVRRSSGTMRQWTHPGMFEYLGANADDYGERPNADATLIGFATGSPSAGVRDRVHREIIAPWAACAMTKACIAPAGSSRKNHRQDQAALSYFVHKAGIDMAGDTRRQIGVRCKCDRWFYQYIGFHVPAAVYARGCLY